MGGLGKGSYGKVIRSPRNFGSSFWLWALESVPAMILTTEAVTTCEHQKILYHTVWLAQEEGLMYRYVMDG